MPKRRRHFKQNITLKDRLFLWAKQVRSEAAKLPPGPARDAMLKKASQADKASHKDNRANFSGTQPPK